MALLDNGINELKKGVETSSIWNTNETTDQTVIVPLLAICKNFKTSPSTSTLMNNRKLSGVCFELFASLQKSQANTVVLTLDMILI